MYEIKQVTLRTKYYNEITRVEFPAGAVVWRIIGGRVPYTGSPFRSRVLAERCAARLNAEFY